MPPQASVLDNALSAVGCTPLIRLDKIAKRIGLSVGVVQDGRWEEDRGWNLGGVGYLCQHHRTSPPLDRRTRRARHP